MSMSSGGNSGGPMSEINVTPLVDVMLVLLIIFMITAPLMSHSITIELPLANPKTPVTEVVVPPTSGFVAQTVERLGVRRLLLLAIPSPTGYVQSHLTSAEKLALAQSPYRTTTALFADCLAACVDDVLGAEQLWIRAEFERMRDAVSATIVDSLFATVSLLAETLSAARTAEKAITAASNIALLSPLTDMREQLSDLIYPGFVSATGSAELRRMPAYLRGITHRVSKLGENLGRDRVWMTEVQSATERYRAAGGELPLPADAPGRIRHARWLLEELRISLFAQHLGTAESVSLQRIVKVLAQ